MLPACSTRPERLPLDYGDDPLPTAPTDDDEFVRVGPIPSTPATPHAQPELGGARGALEALGPVYTLERPGPWEGKQRSHIR